MKKYSIFTEHNSKNEERDREVMNVLEIKLKERGFITFDGEREYNVVVVGYEGNIAQFRPEVSEAINSLDRKRDFAIYIA